MEGNHVNKKRLTFTILSNDAEKVVMRFQMPRISVLITLSVIIISIILLIYFIHMNHMHQQMNTELEENLHIKTAQAHQLQEHIEHLEENEKKIEAKMEALHELESEVKKSIQQLPVDIDSSGGVDIQLSSPNMGRLEQSTTELQSLSNELIKRYESTLEDMKRTTKELQYIPTVWPAESKTVTSDFGIRKDPFNRKSSIHTGIDIRGKIGDPVYASANGTVTLAKYYGGYGNAIIIKHSDKHETLYAHLSNIHVKEGDTVYKGDHIGAIGSTGRSTGPHLHYEIIENGEPIDPYAHLYIFNNF